MASTALPILPLYTRRPVEPSRLRRGVTLLLQLLLAAAYGFAAVALPPQMVFVLMVPVGVCLLIVLWLMPDRGVFPLKGIERCYGFVLVLTIIWPSYIAVVLPGLPWMTPTRLAMFVLSILFLYSVSTSSLLRHHLATCIRLSRPLWVCFLLWQASLFVSIPFSHDIGLTVKIVLNDLLRFTEMLFLGCLIFSRRGVATRSIAIILFLAVLCGIDGFVENHLEMPPWANHIPSFLRIDDATLANVLGSQARSADGLYRVRGPFSVSLLFAEFLALCMPFVIHWFLTGRSLLLRLAMVPLGVFLIATILITHSRLGLVGTLVAIGTYVPLWGFRQWRAKTTSIIGPAMLIGAPLAAIGLVGLILSSHTLTTKVFGGGAQQASTEARAEQVRLAVPKILSNPIGHGRGTSGTVIGFVNPAGYITVDNHYLTTLVDIGVLGAIGFYGVFAAGGVMGSRVYLKTKDRENELAGPLASVCAVFLVTKLVLSEENNHSLALLLLAMLLALVARDRGLVDADTPLPLLARRR
ncbi:MAG: O-antigen ligase family protein [Sphingomonadaceae bacterium]|nr:O-antigen ligase family protein [Sphingomonadaceae bacterium]